MGRNGINFLEEASKQTAWAEREQSTGQSREKKELEPLDIVVRWRWLMTDATVQAVPKPSRPGSISWRRHPSKQLGQRENNPQGKAERKRSSNHYILYMYKCIIVFWSITYYRYWDIAHAKRRHAHNFTDRQSFLDSRGLRCTTWKSLWENYRPISFERNNMNNTALFQCNAALSLNPTNLGGQSSWLGPRKGYTLTPHT